MLLVSVVGVGPFLGESAEVGADAVVEEEVAEGETVRRRDLVIGLDQILFVLLRRGLEYAIGVRRIAGSEWLLGLGI